jgi:hypothetical protein
MPYLIQPFRRFPVQCVLRTIRDHSEGKASNRISRISAEVIPLKEEQFTNPVRRLAFALPFVCLAAPLV